MCLNTYIRGYILPKGKQRMIFMTGYSVENPPLGKGREIFMTLPIQRCLDNWAGNI